MPRVAKPKNKPREEVALPGESRFDETLRRMLNTPPQPKQDKRTKSKGKG